jgi:hypothetical protein
MARNRRGAALALVLWALVIGSAVLTVAVFIGMQERRAAGTGGRLQRAMAHAETGLADALVGWTPGLLGRRLQHPFDSLVVGGGGSGPGAPRWQGAIHRLNRGLFLVAVHASDPPGSSVATVATLSRLGWVVRVRPVPIDFIAAVEAGAVTVGDDAVINGRDRSPVGWNDCEPPDSAIAGVAGDTIDQFGTSQIDGSPPITRTVADTGFPTRQRNVFDQLASQATIELPGGSWSTGPTASAMDCDANDPHNWGDPADPRAACGDYWPIVHIQGDLHLQGGSGHGILLVEGNLEIDGPYRFSGIVLVRGRFETGSFGGSVVVDGAVIVGWAGTAVRPLSGISITYSKCMLSNSLQSSGVLVPLRSRGWKQLF